MIIVCLLRASADRFKQDFADVVAYFCTVIFKQYLNIVKPINFWYRMRIAFLPGRFPCIGINQTVKILLFYLM